MEGVVREELTGRQQQQRIVPRGTKRSRRSSGLRGREGSLSISSVEDAMDIGVNPFVDLQEFEDAWESYKERDDRFFAKPCMLEGFMTGFLQELSKVVLSLSTSPSGMSEQDKKSYADLVARCYHYLPGDPRSKTWPLLKDDDLTHAFRTSGKFPDFLDRCFYRTGFSPEWPPVMEHVPTIYVFKGLHASFQNEFKGDAIQQLHNSLKGHYTAYNPDVYFDRVIPIVNSSGLGKSRLVYELGKQDLMLSVCFRRDRSPGAGWPPGDRGACRFLGEDFSCIGPNIILAEERCAVFYGALCDVVANNLPGSLSSDQEEVLNAVRRHAAVGLDDPHDVARQLMGEWALKPDTQDVSSRARLFFQAEAGAKSILLRDWSKLNSMRTARGISETRTGSSDLTKWCSDLFSYFVEKPLSRLSDAVAKLGFERFFFAFDECGYLNQGGYAMHPKEMSLLALLRIIKAAGVKQLPVTFWHLLLDTSPHVLELTPKKDAPSTSFPRNSTMQPIWPYLTFDAMVSSRPPPETALDTLKVDNYLYYGRPLWNTVSGRDLIYFATRKLYCGSFDPYDKLHVFVAFAQRVLLKLVNNDETFWIAAEAVRKHMLILTAVARNSIFTDCPSEPALAVAAACSLLRDDANYGIAFRTLVQKLILPGCVQDHGTSGELCIRILLLIARDHAIVPENPPRTGRIFVKREETVETVETVTLLEFLNTLLGGAIGDDDPALQEFRSWANKVYLNFSHFIQASNAIEKSVPLSYLESLWHRGAALQCISEQAVLDGFLVGYEGDLSEAFDKTKLVMIPWRTKCGIAAVHKATINGLVCPFIFNGSSYDKPKNHLVLFMDLGTSGPTPDNGLLLNDAVSFSERQSIKETQWDGYHEDPAEEATRFSLAIQGHDSTVYPVTQHLRSGSGDPSFETLLSLTAGSWDMQEQSAVLLDRWNTALTQHTIL